MPMEVKVTDMKLSLAPETPWHMEQLRVNTCWARTRLSADASIGFGIRASTLGCRLGGAKGHRFIGEGDCALGSQEPRRFLGAVGLLVVHLRENVHGIAARRAGEGNGPEYDQ